MFKNVAHVTRTPHTHGSGQKGRGKKRKEKLLQPRRGAAAVPYPDGTVVDHQLDIPKRAGLILGEHRTRHRAGRVQQQAALVPRDQRAPPQVSADEPRRPVVPVERVPLVPQRHDVDGPARTERARGEAQHGQRAGLRSEQEVRGQRGRDGHQPPSLGARHALETDNGRTAARTYMISAPRAGRRLGEKRRLTASRGPRAASPPAIRSSPAASLSRASTAAGPTERGRAAPASERAGHRGGLAGGRRAAATQRPPGNIAGRGAAAQPPVDAAARSPRSAAPPRLAAVASRCCRCRCSSSRRGRGSGRSGPPPPLGGPGAARAGPGGRADTGSALPAEAPELLRRWPDTKEWPARGAAESKLINTTPQPGSSRPPIRLQQVCSTRKAVTGARKGGGATGPPLTPGWKKE